MAQHSERICPTCGKPMISGQLRIEADAGSFALFGFSAMDLVLKPSGTQEKRVVLGPRVSKAGAVCPSCGTSIIFDSDFDKNMLDESFASVYLDSPPAPDTKPAPSAKGRVFAIIAFVLIMATIAGIMVIST